MTHVSGCVKGVTTWVSVPLSNPTPHYVRLDATVAQETLDGRPPTKSSLLFKKGCLLEPTQDVVWAVGVCGRCVGTLQCVLKLTLSDVTSQTTLVTHLLPIVATVTLPDVTVGGGGGAPVDLGLVPVDYLYDTSLELHNRSGRELAVLVTLAHAYATSPPVFQLKGGRDPCVRVVSGAEVACVLQPGTTALPLSIMASTLPGEEEEDGVRVLRCDLTVSLDTPELPRPVVANTCLLVRVVAVHLHVSRNCMPLHLHAAPPAAPSAPLTLKNLSCVPLTVSFRCGGSAGGESSPGNTTLAVVPDSLVIQPSAQASPLVMFLPRPDRVPQSSTSVVVVVVEPYGLEYEVPVHVTSHLKVGDTSPPLPGGGSGIIDDKKEDSPASPTDSRVSAASSTAEVDDSTEATESRGSGDGKSEPLKAIEASKSRLVFGCVTKATTAVQKIAFCNRNSRAVPLALTITGAAAFTIIDLPSPSAVSPPPDHHHHHHHQQQQQRSSCIVIPSEGVCTVLVG